MWPSKKSQGVRIGYGHDGSAIYTPQVSPSTPWQFARRHGLGYNFQSTNIFKTYNLSPYEPISEEDSERINLINQHRPVGTRHSLAPAVAPGIFIPNMLLADYDFESTNTSSRRGYDPFRGPAISVGSIKAKLDKGSGVETDSDVNDGDEEEDDDEFRSRQVVAFTSGRAGYSVDFGYINTSDSIPFINQYQQSISAYVPDIQVVTSYDMNSPVLQVEFADPEPEISPYMLVRTGKGTSILSVISDNESQITVKDVGEIPFQGKGNNPSSDAYHHCCSIFNPWSYSQVGVVNAQGVWGLWDLSVQSTGNLPFSSPNVTSLFNEKIQAFSRWNQIIWGADVNSIVTCNRQYVQLYDIRSGESKGNTILSYSHGETQICGISRSKINDHDMFLLNSDSLVYFDIRKPNEVILSWDHFMDRSDPSLKLTTSAIDDRINLVGVYSQFHHVNVFYQFTESDGLPVSADDPIGIISRPDKITQTMTTIPIDLEGGDESIKMLTCLRLSTDFVLEGEILTSNTEFVKEEEKGINGYNKKYINEHTNGNVNALTSKPKVNDSYKYDYILHPKIETNAKFDFRAMYRFLFENTSQIPEVTSKGEDMQDFAQHLEARINEFFLGNQKQIMTFLELNESTYSDDEVSSAFRLYENLDDLSALIQKLREHYKDTNINLTDLTCKRSGFKSIVHYFNYLLSIWVEPLNGSKLHPNVLEEVISRREKLALYVSIQVTLASIGVHIDREEASNIKISNPLRSLNKYVEVKNIKKFALSSNAEVLLDEWKVGTDVDDYKWHRFGDNPADIEIPSSPPDRYQQITQQSQYSQYSQKRKSRSKSESTSQQRTPFLLSSPTRETMSHITSASQPHRITTRVTSSRSSQFTSYSQPSTRSVPETSHRVHRKKKRTEGFG